MAWQEISNLSSLFSFSPRLQFSAAWLVVDGVLPGDLLFALVDCFASIHDLWTGTTVSNAALLSMLSSMMTSVCPCASVTL